MKTTIQNDKIVIQDPDDVLVRQLTKALSYKDKSKEFQLRRMSKNPFFKNSQQYQQLQSEVNGCLVEKTSSGVVIPSGFAYLLSGLDVDDQRCETGVAVSYPWKKKPFDLRDYQEEAVDMCLNNWRGVVNFATGCHAAGQDILMYDGSIKKVEKIVVGDKLMGPDSKPRNVLELHRGEDEMFEVIPTKGESFIVNRGHILSLEKSYNARGKQNSRRSVPDDDYINISVHEYLEASKGLKHKYKLYRTKVDFQSSGNLSLPPYLLGLWLGDGCARSSKITTADSEIVTYLKEYASSVGTVVERRRQHGVAYDYAIKSVENFCFRSILNNEEIFRNKHIPRKYLTANRQSRLELLAGLLDSDGSLIENKCFDITQKRENLADQIVFLCRSLGLAAYKKPSWKMATNSKNPKKQLYWRITISGDCDKIPTLIARKQAEPREQIKSVLRTGFKLKSAGKGQYYGFSVDGDHLYVMGDFTVTHNSGKTLTGVHLIKKIKRKTLVICPNVNIADNFYDELVAAFGENKVGYFGNGKKKIKDITVGIVQSVKNHIDKFIKEDLGCVLVDETHHIAADTCLFICDKLANVGRIYGLTATDFRSDGKDILITANVGPTIIRRDSIWMIKNGWLRQPYFIVRGIDTVGREYSEDKKRNYKTHILNQKSINDRIISDAKAFMAHNKSVLILVDEVAHGEFLSSQLGLDFAHGKNKNSKQLIKDLNTASIPGLIGTDKYIGEGVDTKNVDVLILANFVASKGLVWQNIGRGLRPFKGNNSLVVLDYIPKGSKMLTRHGITRVKYFKEITNNVKVIDV